MRLTGPRVGQTQAYALHGTICSVADRGRLQTIEEELTRRNPLLVAAADEVDASLIVWALSLSPMERLRACSRAARALTGWRRVTPLDR